MSLALFMPASFALENNVPDLKAAYLANIIVFTQWSDTSDEVNLCMSNKADISHLHTSLNGFDLGGNRSLQVVVDPNNTSVCHVYYWDSNSRAAGKQLPENHASLLIISDLNFSDYPPITVSLYFRNLKLRFSVNMEQLEETDYSISSKLLRLSH